MRLPTLGEFFKGDKRNAYARFPGFKTLYIRKTERFGFPTLDIANIEAHKPGKGAFTFLVRHIRQAYPARAIFVESVLSEQFDAKLRKMGFTCTLDCAPGCGACFFLTPLMELK